MPIICTSVHNGSSIRWSPGGWLASSSLLSFLPAGRMYGLGVTAWVITACMMRMVRGKGTSCSWGCLPIKECRVIYRDLITAKVAREKQQDTKVEKIIRWEALSLICEVSISSLVALSVTMSVMTRCSMSAVPGTWGSSTTTSLRWLTPCTPSTGTPSW